MGSLPVQFPFEYSFVTTKRQPTNCPGVRQRPRRHEEGLGLLDQGVLMPRLSTG